MATDKPKPNSVARGSMNLWPVILMVAIPAGGALPARSAEKVEALEKGKAAEVETAKARALAAEVKAGEHDAYLFELLALEFGHAHRDVVISAIQARAGELKLTDIPTDPRSS